MICFDQVESTGTLNILLGISIDSIAARDRRILTMRQITEDYKPSEQVKWLHNRHRWDFNFDSAPQTFPALVGDHSERDPWLEGCAMNGLVYAGIGIGIVILLLLGYFVAFCCCKPKQPESNDVMESLMNGTRKTVYNKKRIIFMVLLSFGFVVVAASTFAPVRSFDSAFNNGLDAVKSVQNLFARVEDLTQRTATKLGGPISITKEIKEEIPSNKEVGAFLDALRSAKNGAENARDSVHDLVKHTGNLIDNGRDASDKYGKPIAYTYAAVMCLTVLVLLLTMIPWRVCACAYKCFGVPTNLVFLLVLWIGTGVILVIGLMFADYCTAPNGNIWKSVKASSLESESSESVYFYLSCDPNNLNPRYTQDDGVIYTLNQTKYTMKTEVVDRFEKLNKEIKKSDVNESLQNAFAESKDEIDSSFSIISDAVSLVNCTNVRKPWGQMINALCGDFISSGVIVLIGIQTTMGVWLASILLFGWTVCVQHPGQATSNSPSGDRKAYDTSGIDASSAGYSYTPTAGRDARQQTLEMH